MQIGLGKSSAAGDFEGLNHREPPVPEAPEGPCDRQSFLLGWISNILQETLETYQSPGRPGIRDSAV